MVAVTVTVTVTVTVVFSVAVTLAVAVAVTSVLERDFARLNESLKKGLPIDFVNNGLLYSGNGQGCSWN